MVKDIWSGLRISKANCSILHWLVLISRTFLPWNFELVVDFRASNLVLLIF